MKAMQVGTLVAFAALGSAAYAAPPHSLTYSQVSVAPGTFVTIGGTQFVAVQVPMRQFNTDKRYAVRFLSPVVEGLGGNAVFADLHTQHVTDALAGANATIDTFSAKIEVSDGRTYSVRTVLDPETFEPGNRLQVEATAVATVQVKVGDALLTFFGNLSVTDQDVALGAGEEYRGTAKAAYGKYTDPVGLVGQVSGLDKWIDYIRIIPLN